MECLVDKYFGRLYENYEESRKCLIRQARDLLVCEYHGCLLKFENEFCIQAERLLQYLKVSFINISSLAIERCNNMCAFISMTFQIQTLLFVIIVYFSWYLLYSYAMRQRRIIDPLYLNPLSKIVSVPFTQKCMCILTRDSMKVRNYSLPTNSFRPICIRF